MITSISKYNVEHYTRKEFAEVKGVAGGELWGEGKPKLALH